MQTLIALKLYAGASRQVRMVDQATGAIVMRITVLPNMGYEAEIDGAARWLGAGVKVIRVPVEIEVTAEEINR